MNSAVLTLYLETMLVAPTTWLLSIVSVDVGWYSAPSWSSCVVETEQRRKKKQEKVTKTRIVRIIIVSPNPEKQTRTNTHRPVPFDLFAVLQHNHCGR